MVETTTIEELKNSIIEYWTNLKYYNETLSKNLTSFQLAEVKGKLKQKLESMHGKSITFKGKVKDVIVFSNRDKPRIEIDIGIQNTQLCFESNIKKDDLILIKKDDIIPVSGIVSSRWNQSDFSKIIVTIEEEIQPSEPKKKESNCFVATACYGDYDAPEVLVLRQFRDNRLLTNKIGQLFVETYYAISPFIARVISRSDILKNFVRRYIFHPLVTRLQQQNKNASH